MTTTTKKPAAVLKAGPAPRIKVTVNGTERELFMSFGLLNEICRGVGDVQAAIQISTNAELRDYVLLAVLSERNDEGEVAKAINLRTLEMTIDDVENLLAWVTEHTVDFFLRTIERVVTQQKANEGRFLALKAANPQAS